MKEIRRINKVAPPESRGSNYHEEEFIYSIESFDSAPEYYRQVIRPMLYPGHENELVYLLRELSIIKDTIKCKKCIIGKNNLKLSWTSARISDLFEWKCNGCKEKRSIREDSVFDNIRCSLKSAIRIILGWCKARDTETISLMLGVTCSVIGALYNKLSGVAERYMSLNAAEWQIGGPGKIILVDTYPEGCSNRNHIRSGRPILCLAEMKSIPQKYWLETLNGFNDGDSTQIKLIQEHIRMTIRKMIMPGSILLTTSNSTLCPYEEILPLNHLYPTIIRLEDLERHNSDQHNLSVNLETIWKSVLDVCEEAQFYHPNLIQQFIVSHMWRKRYSEDSFEMLLYQLSLFV